MSRVPPDNTLVNLFRMKDRIQFLADGCWIWTGWKDQDGYGRMWVGGRYQLTHRVAYQSIIGPIADGLQIDHLCRVRHCQNPWHMEPVTHEENVMRGFGLPARNARKTHCKRGHPLSGDNVRLGYFNGRKRRACRQCEKYRYERLRSNAGDVAVRRARMRDAS